jgi:RNA polymerase sigma-70 factor (ECF subfamily)
LFPTTRWTIVLRSREGEPERRAALEALLPLYWKPVYFFLRRKGLSVAAAEDATQGFFVHVIEHDLLPRVEPSRGRFRSYLLTSLDHYLINLHERESAVKRGGRMKIISIDTVLAERELPAAAVDPTGAFEREWAESVLDRAVRKLAVEYETGRRKGPAGAFLRFFRLDEDPPSYDTAAAECGLTPVQFKAALHRARGRFRELVLEEIADTVPADGDPEAELRALLQALRA